MPLSTPFKSKPWLLTSRYRLQVDPKDQSPTLDSLLASGKHEIRRKKFSTAQRLLDEALALLPGAVQEPVTPREGAEPISEEIYRQGAAVHLALAEVHKAKELTMAAHKHSLKAARVAEAAGEQAMLFEVSRLRCP